MEDLDLKEEIFNTAVRDYIISMLLLLLVYLASFWFLSMCRKKSETVTGNYTMSEENTDALVDRISVWICSFSIAVSVGACLLLPASIISNEIRSYYPDVYYFKWLNSSLINGLWRGIFLTSNLSVFVLLPFSYFFIESSGFSGARRGIWGRVYEAAIVLFLVTLLFAGFFYVTISLFGGDNDSRNFILYIFRHFLPLLYSGISLLGVVMLLIFTPVGFFRIFTVVGNLVMKPQSVVEMEETLHQNELEEATLRRKIVFQKTHKNGFSPSNKQPEHKVDEDVLAKLCLKKAKLEQKISISSWRRTFTYPILMLLILLLTSVAVLTVAVHCLQLLIDEKALPTFKQHVNIGNASLSTFGAFGAALEVFLIFYFISATLVGCYTSPGFRRLLPHYRGTSMTVIIINCWLILILSSALPLLCRTLGITNFDLLGSFGEIEWLGNFYVILTYNLMFATCTALIMVKNVTFPLLHAIMDRLGIPALESVLRKWQQRLKVFVDEVVKTNPFSHHRTVANAKKCD